MAVLEAILAVLEAIWEPSGAEQTLLATPFGWPAGWAETPLGIF